MTVTAAELRRRAREDLKELTRRREAVAVAAVSLRNAAETAKAEAATAVRRATEALAAASVTFGGPEKAAAITGISAAELRAARREVSAERAAEVADALPAPRTSPRAARRPPEVGRQAAAGPVAAGSAGPREEHKAANAPTLSTGGDVLDAGLRQLAPDTATRGQLTR